MLSSAGANCGGRGEAVGGDRRERLPDRRVDRRRARSAAGRRTLGTGSLSRLAMIACAVGPVNGGSPASISYSTAPSE